MQKIKQILNVFKIDFSFVFVFCFAILIDEIGFYVCYVIFLILHEISHFFVAKKLGYYSKQIRLNCFGAVLEGEDDFALKDEIKIVLAGPIFNFCVVIFCYLSFWFFPESYEILCDVLKANLAILMFNMLPIFPLDFGRFILLYFTKKRHRIDALRCVRIISFLFIGFLFILFLISSFFVFNFSLGLVSLNLMFMYFSNSEDTSFKRQLFVDRKFKLLKTGLLERTIYVDYNISLFSLLKFIDDHHYVKFVFLDSNYKMVKQLDEVEFYRQTGLL